jgi:hypothetical protein
MLRLRLHKQYPTAAKSRKGRLDCGVQGGLDVLDALERGVVIEQVPGLRLVGTFDLPDGRAGGLGEAVHDPVVPADPIEEHLATPPEPGGELLAVEFLSDVNPWWGLSGTSCEGVIERVRGREVGPGEDHVDGRHDESGGRLASGD